MSCEGHWGKYLVEHLAASGSISAQVFGSPEAAANALEELYQLGRNGPKPPDKARDVEAQTRLMFSRMQKKKIKPPSHSKSGLPKREAQYGYGLVQETVTALERGESLPPQARLYFQNHARYIQNLRPDKYSTGRMRCGSCGRFASVVRGHTCPRTATPEAFQRSLARRLGLPRSAFPLEELNSLLETARNDETVIMKHSITGENVAVTLDALPIAMGNGFTPISWLANAEATVAADGLIYNVLDSSLPKPAEPTTALEAAAFASGLQLDPGMKVIELPLEQPQPQLEQAEAQPETTIAVGTAETFAFGSDPTRSYKMRNRVIDLDDLIPSNLDNGSINPAYDPSLQPRQRDRAASQAQIAKVAQKLTPDALLTDFKQLDKGAPIIGHEDSCVESGNGRVLALRKARESYPAQWNAYQARLKEVAASLGIDPAELAGMKSPVLVRERVEDVDRAVFAREANAPPVLQMSTLENATIDAKRITDDMLLRLTVKEDQSIDLALRARSNQGFVRDFMQTLSDNERAMLMRSDGTLNQQGIARIKAALFTRTFPGEAGKRLAETFTEALDSTTKNFEQAIAGTLPALVRAQSLIGNGQRSSDMDLSGDFAVALDMLARLREQEMPVNNYLEQSKMFGAELSPFQEDVLRHFDSIGRSSKSIRKLLSSYAQEIEQAPHPDQGSMFFDMGSVSKDQIFARMTKGNDVMGDMFA